MTAASADARTLLLIDDDVTLRTRLARAFETRGLIVTMAGTCDEAIALAQADPPELALVDLRLPGGSGIDVVRELRATDPTTTIIVLTGYGSIATAVESMRSGAKTYLTKPVDADQIIAAFNQVEMQGAQQPAIAVPSLARVEWEHIQRVLAECGGNLSQAARLLGIHRRSLQRKLAKDPGRETHQS